MCAAEYFYFICFFCVFCILYQQQESDMLFVVVYPLAISCYLSATHKFVYPVLWKKTRTQTNNCIRPRLSYLLSNVNRKMSMALDKRLWLNGRAKTTCIQENSRFTFICCCCWSSVVEQTFANFPECLFVI